MPSTEASSPCLPAPAFIGDARLPPEPGLRMVWVGRSHRERASLQSFIAQTFRQSYNADIHHFSEILFGCQDRNGQWLSALGYTPLQGHDAFLEQYLSAPVEQEIGSRSAQAVARSEIVEVGNMAGVHAGASRALIVHMTRHLNEQGFKWVAFTATPSLLNSFRRLRLHPTSLGLADPEKLANQGRNWGSYYDTKPQVMFGNIEVGYAQLAR